MRRKLTALSVIAVAGLVSGLFYAAVLKPAWNSRQEELRMQTSLLSAEKETVKTLPSLTSLWSDAKNYVPDLSSTEDHLNAWAKDLIAYSQSNGIVFSRIEPQKSQGYFPNGASSGRSGEARSHGNSGLIRLDIAFDGTLETVTKFLVYLAEKDPLSSVEKMQIRYDPDDKRYSYKLSLARTVPLL